MSKISEQWIEQDDKLIHVKTQNWNPMLERAEAMRQNGNADFGIYTNPFNDIKGKGTVLMFLAINYAKNVIS